MKSRKTLYLILAMVLTVTSDHLCAQGVNLGDGKIFLRPFVYTPVWRGESMDTLIYSKALGYEKNVSIFAPEKFGENPDETYPLIILFDRHFKDLSNYIIHSIDMLEVYGQIPRPVVVSIEAGRLPGLRRKEAQWSIDGPESHGEKVDEFIFDELIPYISDEYRIDENQIIVYGHSWHGYHSSMLLVNHIPDLFAVISASPCCLSSERIDEIVEGIANSASRDRKFFYRVASGHDIGDNLDVYRELTGKISIMRQPEMFDYKTTWLNAAMHMEVPPLLFIQSLYEIYADWADLAYAYADPANHPTFDDARLMDSLQQLSDDIYGIHIPIYDRHIRMRVEYYSYIKDKEVRHKGKISTWEFMISRYGESPEAYYEIAQNYFMLDQPGEAKKNLDKVKAFELDKEWKNKVKDMERKIK